MTSNPDASVPPLAFIGYVETTVDALRLIHAARQGIIPRITRRLSDSERNTMIRSGAVFAFCMQESRIKRWTDGLLWSPSRILDNFLVYREINERTTHRGHKKPYLHDDSPTRSLTVKSSPDRASMTRGGDQDTFKTGGLIKKTITVIVQESGPEPTHLHLISYYTSDDIRSGKLNRPSTRADIMDLYIPPHIFRLTTFRVPPMVEIGPDGKHSEGDDVDCEVELEDTSGFSIPASPPWLSPDSLTSPVVNPFHGTSLYPLSSGHTTIASSSVYASRGAPNEGWPGPNTMLSLIQPQPQEMSWSPPAGSVLSSGHRMSRRQDDVVQYETWPSILPSWYGLPIVNGFNGLTLRPTSDTVGTDRSKSLASPIECPSPPSSLADTTGESSRTHTVLQGTISALKFIQQKFGLASVPGLPNLVGVVLNISEVVNNIYYTAEDALVELAQNAGSFTVTLVSLLEQGSDSTFSDPDSMKSIIEGLTKVMNRVLGVVSGISFQRLSSRLPLSASDKVAVDECNRQIALACGVFGIRIGFIAQKAVTRIEARLNQALKTLHELNQQTTNARRPSTR